jgi:transcriptional regulator with XRE-family HTH domain
MLTRKDIRERLGLSIKQMSEIVGLPVTTLASLESRKARSSAKVDEIYLLYLQYVEQTNRGIFEDLENSKRLIFSKRRISIENRIRSLHKNISLYRKQLEAAKQTYTTSISTFTSYSFLKDVAAAGSIDLQDRIEIARLNHLKKTFNNQHNTVLRTTMRLEWSILEMNLLLEMLAKNSIV